MQTGTAREREGGYHQFSQHIASPRRANVPHLASTQRHRSLGELMRRLLAGTNSDRIQLTCQRVLVVLQICHWRDGPLLLEVEPLQEPSAAGDQAGAAPDSSRARSSGVNHGTQPPSDLQSAEMCFLRCHRGVLVLALIDQRLAPAGAVQKQSLPGGFHLVTSRRALGVADRALRSARGNTARHQGVHTSNARKERGCGPHLEIPPPPQDKHLTDLLWAHLRNCREIAADRQTQTVKLARSFSIGTPPAAWH